MQCMGILHEVCSFLTKADLFKFRQVSLLTYAASCAFLTEVEYQWLAAPSVHRMRVELAPPCTVLAMAFLESRQKIFVCTTNVGHGCVVECGFYIHEVNAFSESTRRYVELPGVYGAAESDVRFEGNRFLVCRRMDEFFFVFDCMLEMPVGFSLGCEEFFASPDGTRLATIYEGYMHYSDSHSGLKLPCEISTEGSAMECPFYPFVQLQQDHSLFSVSLHMEDLFWSTICVGRHSVLLLRGDTSVSTWECHDTGGNVSKWTFETLSLGSWGGDRMCCVCSISSGEDEYVIASFTGEFLLFVNPLTRRVSVQRLQLPSFRQVLVQRFEVLRPGSSYAVVLSHHQTQEVLVFSADMSVVRHIKLGSSSTLTLLPSEGVMIASTPSHSTFSTHPLLEAVESGVGTVFFFSEVGEPHFETCHGKESFTGVEILSWISFCLVSASFLWTASAFVYNGWWLHLQLLFCGRVA